MPDPPVGPEVALERPRPVGRGHRRPLGGEGVVALEQVGLEVVDVDVRRRRRSACEAKPMIWPYFRTGSPLRDVARARPCAPARSARGPRPSRSPSLRTKPRGIGRAATATLSSPRSRTALGGSVAVAIARPLGWTDRQDVELTDQFSGLERSVGKAVYPVGVSAFRMKNADAGGCESFPERTSHHAFAISGYGPLSGRAGALA